MKKALLLSAAIVLVTAFPLTSSATKGFYVGTGIGYSIPQMGGDVMDDLEPQSGIALEIIHLGYNFTDNLGASVQWGAGAGPGDNLLGHDTLWSEGYLDISGRFSYPLNQTTPYVEVGLGNYSILIEGEDGDIMSDPAIGGRLALGANFYINNFYVAPELSYHFVQFDDAERDHDFLGKGSIDFEEDGNMLLLLVKVGYHWKEN